MKNDDYLLPYSIAPEKEMEAWPVDRKRSGEKLWAETTWGGDRPGRRKLFNWNTWPCRVVFRVDEGGGVARGKAFWRRSCLSIRMKGLKLTSAEDGQEITAARVINYNQEYIELEFHPATGPGLYYLYYGASEPFLFNPEELSELGEASPRVEALPLEIEARCELDSFYPMEVVALSSEVEELLFRYPDRPYLVFPEDRDRPIKLHLELPYHWAQEGPRQSVTLSAEANEYRVFQLGIWACREDLEDLRVKTTGLTGQGRELPGDRVQCLTLESRIKSSHIQRPEGPFNIPCGQIRALWFGIDLPEEIEAGTYTGRIAVEAEGLPATEVDISVVVEDRVLADKGDHEPWRLSRLRWLESDIGLSDEVFSPYTPLKTGPDGEIETWGHRVSLDEMGLPIRLAFQGEDVLHHGLSLSGKDVVWKEQDFRFEKVEEGFVTWEGSASSGVLCLDVSGRMEYDGCMIIDLEINAAEEVFLEDLKLSISWQKEHAELAAGMGYRGLRDGGRVWRDIERGARCFSPAVWMGSVQAGLGFKTWDREPWAEPGCGNAAETLETGDDVRLVLNLGDHSLKEQPWQMKFALLPTPVKPPDMRHWQFRYLHRGGDFMPGDDDTPHSFLQDDCARLDKVKDLGVKRLNLHDWWGPAFNYPQEWERPLNLSRLTEEAHRRGLYVKVYNSGREFSNLAPEFYAVVFEGAGYEFPAECDPEPRLRYQDAWHANHMPDGLPQGWPRVHEKGNEHTVPVSNSTRIGNFYLEGIRYMTRFFGTDGAYWDGADGPTLGHREMAKRMWTMFRKTKPEATIDVHHGHGGTSSPITQHMLCFPFIDSLWHGEGFDYEHLDPWAWLVEIAALPFGVPSEMLGGEDFLGRGMLFGIWPRAGWGAGTEKQKKLWAFFDEFRIEEAEMYGWWEDNGIRVDRPDTYVTAYSHPEHGLFFAVATWHPPVAAWMEETLDVTLHIGNESPLFNKLPVELKGRDILTGEEVDLTYPLPLPDVRGGRLIWVKYG